MVIMVLLGAQLILSVIGFHSRLHERPHIIEGLEGAQSQIRIQSKKSILSVTSGWKGRTGFDFKDDEHGWLGLQYGGLHAWKQHLHVFSAMGNE